MHVHRETGALVTLESQDEKGMCTFTDPTNGGRHELPSHQFFTLYREPTADELAAIDPGPPDKISRDELNALTADATAWREFLARQEEGALVVYEGEVAKKLNADLEKATADAKALKTANGKLEKDLATVTDQRDKLKADNTAYREDVSTLNKEVKNLKAELAKKPA